jgi:hypothetical protein
MDNLFNSNDELVDTKFSSVFAAIISADFPLFCIGANFFSDSKLKYE